MGLNVQSNSATASAWTCPDRQNETFGPGLPNRELAGTEFQWVIGYCYFGGMTNWDLSTSGGATWVKGHSPIKTTTSKPYWALAADSLIKAATPLNWAPGPSIPSSDARYYIYENTPPHKKGGRFSGANEVFIDGSAGWRSANAYKFYHFSHWQSGYLTDGIVYWSQDTSDFDVAPLASPPTIPPINMTQLATLQLQSINY
jgi:hypothetical protein